jgi:ribose transport system permease protein
MIKNLLESSLGLVSRRPQGNSSAMTDQVLDSPRRRPFVLGQQAGLVVILVLLGALFTSKSPGFLSSFNLFVLGRSLAIDIVIGFSQMVVLATGGMNLSVGAIGVCVVMMGGYLMQAVGLPVPIACALALVLGGALGWLNGFAVARSGVNSFIVTLASANLFSGAMLILTKATPLNSLPRSVAAFGQMRIGGGWLSPMLAVAVAIAVALMIFYRYSVIGRQSLATGANQRAAEMSGVPVGRRIVGAHALSGVLAGVAGLLTVARVGAAMPAVGGQDWLLPSFLGPVLGGAALAGGFVSVGGTVLGAALVTTIRSGLLVMGIGNFWLDLFLGLFLLAAVLLQRYRGVLAPRSRMRWG